MALARIRARVSGITLPARPSVPVVLAPHGAIHGRRKGRKGSRDEYATPVPCALAICRRLAEAGLDPARVVEPSAGHGNFVCAIHEAWPGAQVLAVDTGPKNRLPLYRAGAASVVTGRFEEQDLAGYGAELMAGCPPFSVAEAHVRRALAVLRDGAHLAFLLPLTFLGTKGRAEALWSPPPFGQLKWLFPLVERPSFTEGGGNDMLEYAVYAWQKGYTGAPSILPPLSWRPRRGAPPARLEASP
jgi:hypothetical protein